MENEIWKDIKDYEGLYQISNLGNVKSLNYRRTGVEKILKLTRNGRGYFYVSLFGNGIINKKSVHRLVAETFIPNPNNKPDIDHIDTIKTNNHIENLQWVTHKENCNNPISKINYSIAHAGEKHPHYGKTGALSNNYGKLGSLNKCSISVLQFSKDGELITEFAGSWEAQRMTGINQSSIIKVCKGKMRTAGGYIWKYKL